MGKEYKTIKIVTDKNYKLFKRREKIKIILKTIFNFRKSFQFHVDKRELMRYNKKKRGYYEFNCKKRIRGVA